MDKDQDPVKRALLVLRTFHAQEGHILMERDMYLNSFLNSTLRTSLEEVGTAM